MLKRLFAGLMIVMCSAGTFAQTIGVQHRLGTTPETQAAGVDVHASAHKCCHSSSVNTFEIAVPPPPAHMPCGNEHACCVRPGPVNVAEVPSTSGQLRSDAQQRGMLLAYSDGSVNLPVGAALCSSSLLPYGALKTVLRI